MSRHLTPREEQVHVLYARGYTGNEMAAELGISRKTVKNHIYNINSKTNGMTPKPPPKRILARCPFCDRRFDVDV